MGWTVPPLTQEDRERPCPSVNMNLTLFFFLRNRVSADVVNLTMSSLGWALFLRAWCPHENREVWTRTQSKESVLRRAEIAITSPQAKCCLGLPEPERGREPSFTGGSAGSSALPAPWFQTWTSQDQGNKCVLLSAAQFVVCCDSLREVIHSPALPQFLLSFSPSQVFIA